MRQFMEMEEVREDEEPILQDVYVGPMETDNNKEESE